jgi:type II secretory pathway pseudopilin PulG
MKNSAPTAPKHCLANETAESRMIAGGGRRLVAFTLIELLVVIVKGLS